MSGYDDPYAWERKSYLAANRVFLRPRVTRADRKTCVECGRWYYSAGAHFEECAGPRKAAR